MDPPVTAPRVPIWEYRSLRSWFRRRHGIRCEECGYLVDGFRTGLDAWMEAERHRAWHRWAQSIRDVARTYGDA